jgi:tRNA A-37 threonylcarbamoyl transferase component Bud32
MMRALGRYELVRPLARGGMAELFLARRRGAAGVEKSLVIKRIRPERAADPRFLELFVREARLSMSLAHQNIVPVFDFGRAGDELFLAMEHVDGHDLGWALARAGGSVDPVLAAYIAAECCEGLAYAHEHHVIHRDVSPRNVLLSAAGEVKLVDFGVATIAGQGEGRRTGTPAYMAPEQSRGEAVDGRADLFALGLVLWEMVTGRRARERPDDTVPPPPPDLPEALAHVIRRATGLTPGARYADARAMHDDLDAFVVAARAERPGQPSPARRLGEWLRGLQAGAEGGGEPGDIAVPAGPAVTFMDDGEDKVLGVATQRSMAETIGETIAAPPLDPQPAPPPLAAAAPPAPAPRRARWPWVALVMAGGGLAWAIATRGGGAPAPVTVPAAPDAAPTAVLVAAAAPPPLPSVPADAAVVVVAVTPDAAPPPTVRRPGKAPPTPPPVPAVRRAVTVGSRPWAYFTVDADPRRYETPATVQLTPGAHVLHFENPVARIRRDVTIDVPADRDLEHVEVLTP